MPAPSQSIICFFEQTPVRLLNRKPLKDFIVSIFKREKKKILSLNYIFCTDAELLAINRQFLKHDYYTDIISFDLSASGAPLVAEIYISVDRVKENAKTLAESFEKELHRVIFHGVLHLCGYGDKTKKAALEMRKQEDRCLARYFKLIS